MQLRDWYSWPIILYMVINQLVIIIIIKIHNMYNLILNNTGISELCSSN